MRDRGRWAYFSPVAAALFFKFGRTVYSGVGTTAMMTMFFISPRASSRRGHKMVWNILRVLISSVILVAVAELSKRQPRLGAVLLTLPIVSILAFTLTWFEHRELAVISKLAKETLVLVPLTLPFFVPLAFADRLHLGFWPAMLGGLLLASLTVGLWVMFGPNSQA